MDHRRLSRDRATRAVRRHGRAGGRARQRRRGDAGRRGDDVSLETILTVTLEDLGGGKTKLTLTQTGWSDDAMAAGASAGWNESFDKLAATLADG